MGIRRFVVMCLLLGCVVSTARMSLAQAIQDDLTTMTSEQRRAYLEEYLRKLSPAPEPFTQPPTTSVKPQPDLPVVMPAPAVAAPLPLQTPPLVAEPLGRPAREEKPRPGFVSIEKELVCSGGAAVASVSPWSRLRDNAGLPESAQWLLRSQLAFSGRFGAVLKENDTYFLEQRCAQDAQKVARYAQVSFSSGKWLLDFGNGLVAEGGVLVPTQQGFLLDQKGVLMEFRLGAPARMVRLPSGYRLAELQNSDVSDSRVVLLLSTGLLKSSLNWKDFKDLFRLRGLAEEVGTADSRHPAVLYHLDDGKVWAVDLDASDVEPSLKGFCNPQAWIDSLSCGPVSERKWLMTEDGAQRQSSYFWKLGWVKSGSGFSLWFFDQSRSELVLSQSDGTQVRRQVLPKAVRGLWWRVDGSRPVVMMDTDL